MNSLVTGSHSGGLGIDADPGFADDAAFFGRRQLAGAFGPMRLGKNHLGGGPTALLPQAQADGDNAQASASSPAEPAGQALSGATVVRGSASSLGS